MRVGVWIVLRRRREFLGMVRRKGRGKSMILMGFVRRVVVVGRVGFVLGMRRMVGGVRSGKRGRRKRRGGDGSGVGDGMGRGGGGGGGGVREMIGEMSVER